MATALVMLAAPGNPEANGRMVHMLTSATNLREAGEEVALYFHGAGVNWATDFHVREDRFTQAYGEKFDSLKPLIAGACNFCTNVRFGQTEAMEALGIGMLGPDGGLFHQLGRQLVPKGIGVIRVGYRRPNDLDLCVHDTVAAMELAGHRPRMVQGHRDNIKITLPADLTLAAFYLQGRSIT